jgi:hypothetical protein
MSEEFHVHGHEHHEIEHKAHSGDALAGRIAVLTAILSTLGAVFAYQGAATENRAMMLKNEAVLKKAEAADQWAFYQSKSQKQSLAELASLRVTAEQAPGFKDKVARYDREKKEIQTKAEELDNESARLNAESEHTLHPHHHLARAMTLLQISIALASIAALTRRRWLVWMSAGAAAVGIGFGLAGWMA